MWSVERAFDLGGQQIGVVRLDAGGLRTRTSLPGDLQPLWPSGGLQLLSDGTMALVAQHGYNVPLALRRGRTLQTIAIVRTDDGTVTKEPLRLR